jgi:outer membrane receptor for ferrienterochelin and colicins
MAAIFKRSIIGCALMLSILELSAQYSIKGKIYTEDDKLLAGANVVIANTSLGAASRHDGTYEISGLKNGEHRVWVSFFGYETMEKQVNINNQDVILDFEMIETTIDLNTIVVTGTKTEKNLKNTPVVTQIISSRELEHKDVNDITHALELSVPGIEFESHARGKSMTLQGIDSRYMLFLVDGERLAGETQGDIDYSRINIADIQRIEVVKGASSTLYGSNALGGVINIITKDPKEKFDLSCFSRFSNYNTQNYQLSVGSKLGKFSTQTSSVFNYTDGYDMLSGDSFRTQEREDAVVINEHIKYSATENLLFEGNVSFMNKNRDNTLESLYDRRNKNFTYGAKATWFWNSRNNISLTWNSDNYELLNKVTENELVSDYDNLSDNARLQANFKLADWNFLTFGAEYVSENLTAPRNNIEDKTNRDYIVFAQEDIQMGKSLNFIGGLRAHNNSQYGWHFTPQTSAMYKIWDFTLRGNYSIGYKTPTLKEKYMSFQIPAPGPPMFLVGFEGLEPETSKYTSFSVEYIQPGISLTVSVYRNNISDMISEDMENYTVKQGGVIEYAYRNYGEVLLKGVDMLLKSKLYKNLFFTGSLTFSKKYDKLEDKEFENVRNFYGKFNLDYNLNAKYYNLNLNLQNNYYGAKTINLMNEMTHEMEILELSSFSLWKLTSTHTFKSNYFMKAGIDNIFNFTDESGGYNTGNPGRTFFVGLGIKI